MLRRHPYLSAITGVYGVGLLTIALLPQLRLASGFAGGFLVFVPVGVLGTLLLGRRHWGSTVFFGVVLACWFQLARNVWHPERSMVPAEFVGNAAGILLGSLVVVLMTRPATRHGQVKSTTFTRVAQERRQGLATERTPD